MTRSWLAEKIEPWPTDKLIPYARNARQHSDAQVAQIAASIAEFGFTTPILAGSDGVIVAGHGRLAAAQKLGLITVPVHVGTRSYAQGNQGGPALTAPYIWLQAGIEVALSQARAWTAAFSLGATWLPQIHVGLLANARIARLLRR